MIDVDYSERFLKDLKKLKNTEIYRKAKEFCFNDLPSCEDMREIKNLKKIQGYACYYRIRLGDYRFGLKIEGKLITLMRFLHRKDIYKYFP